MADPPWKDPKPDPDADEDRPAAAGADAEGEAPADDPAVADSFSPTLPDPTALLGKTLGGRYQVEAILGDGGMATVYGGHDTQLGRDVAIKVLRDAIADDPELRGRFEREAKVLAALSHPHIVSLLDFGVDDGAPFLVMELLRGRPLGDVLADGARLPWDRAVRLVKQIIGAVSFAHGEGFLHRDLKPDNVFLMELDTLGDHVQLLDFGFAKLTDAERRTRQLTNADRLFGTPRYLAPEQLRGSDVDARADLYAVGVIFFQMLAGRRPFEGSIREVLRAKALEDAPSLAEAAPDAPTTPELEAFLARALAREPEDRFADGPALLEALEALDDPAEGAPDEAAPERRLPEEAPRREDAGAPSTPASDAPPSEGPPPSAARPRVDPLRAARLGFAGLVLALPSVALCVALIGLATTDAIDASAGAKAPPPTASERERPEEGLEESADPWDRDVRIDPAVAAARLVIVAEQPVESHVLRAVRRRAREAPDDLYAQLVLGHVFTQRGMRAMAVGAYERALTIDPGAAGDPRLVVDLIALAAEDGAGEGPSRLLRTYLPDRALPIVERALAQTGLDARRRRRLESLRDALEAR